jgi:hypothetical protein
MFEVLEQASDECEIMIVEVKQIFLNLKTVYLQ